MKPSDKQLSQLKADIAAARARICATNADIGRVSGVHPSQVSRICDGDFRTLSHNVVQICNALTVPIPKTEHNLAGTDLTWLQAQSSLRKLWEIAPERGQAIVRLLDVLSELQSNHKE